jgi:hypothetical protein
MWAGGDRRLAGLGVDAAQGVEATLNQLSERETMFRNMQTDVVVFPIVV